MRARPAAAWIFGALLGAAVTFSPYLYLTGIGMMAFPLAVAVALLLVFASRQPSMG